MNFTPFKINLVMCVRGAVLVILVWLVLGYHHIQETVKVDKIPGIIYMLQWTPSDHEPFAFMGKGCETFLRRKCTFMNCYVTSNKKWLGGITDFDVVLFHGKDIVLDQAKDMPLKRSQYQRYVFASLESAGYYPIPYNTLKSYFNLTWTFRIDSDINFGYLAVRNRDGDVIGPSKDIDWISHDKMLPVNDTITKKMANKKKAAAWFVSNCDTPNKRYYLVKEIQRQMKDYGMSVDVYGACGDKKCPRSSMDECLKLLENDYYFYFSFENSFAEDYVTEKLLHALKHFTVPVVYGGADYKRFMPDGTYLDARKLEPKELVKQMFEIITNPDRYREYFKWHNHYSYHDVEESPDTDPYCKLCESLNKMQKERKTTVIHDIESWWNSQTDQEVYNRWFIKNNAASTRSQLNMLLIFLILAAYFTVLS